MDQRECRGTCTSEERDFQGVGAGRDVRRPGLPSGAIREDVGCSSGLTIQAAENEASIIHGAQFSNSLAAPVVTREASITSLI